MGFLVTAIVGLVIVMHMNYYFFKKLPNVNKNRGFEAMSVGGPNPIPSAVLSPQQNNRPSSTQKSKRK